MKLSGISSKFMGMDVVKMSISSSVNAIETSSMGDYFYSGIQGNKCHEISMSLFVPNATNTRVMDYLLGNEISISSLGDSVVCQYCGFKVRPGAKTCPHCGAHAIEIVPQSRYDRVCRCLVSEYKILSSYNGLCTLDLDMRVNGDIRMGSSFWSEWSTTHVEDGWLCAYCNSVNPSESCECVGCGAGELPYSDISGMMINCLYCGEELKGETVCRGCSSAQSGYSAWMPNTGWEN